MGFIGLFTSLAVGRGLGPAGYFIFAKYRAVRRKCENITENLPIEVGFFDGGSKPPPYNTPTALYAKLKFDCLCAAKGRAFRRAKASYFLSRTSMGVRGSLLNNSTNRGHLTRKA